MAREERALQLWEDSVKLQRCAVKAGILNHGQIPPHSPVCASARLPGDFLPRVHAAGLLLHVWTTAAAVRILLGGGHCLWGAHSPDTGELCAS